MQASTTASPDRNTTDRVERLRQRARRYLAEGQLVHARATLESIRACAPDDARGCLLEGDLAWYAGRFRDAARCALDAARADNTDPAVACEVAEALWRVGEVTVLRGFLDTSMLACAESGALLSQVADLRQRLKENRTALGLIERARALGEQDTITRFHHGVQLAFNGRLAEAESELAAVQALDPANGRAAVTLARLHRQTPERNHLAAIDRGLGMVAQGSREHAGLEFARFEELDDLERFDEAWQALARGNAIMHARLRFDAAAFRQHVDGLIAHFEAPAARGEATGPQPIFILGMPRSGTTLVERILGNQSAVAQGGELEDLERQACWVTDHASTRDEAFRQSLPTLDFAALGHRYLAQTQWRAHGKRFFTDKQPPNWLLLGLIAAALPGARIVHLVRDPLDVCFSNWRTFFGDTCGYSYDLPTLASYYADYRRLMGHWHQRFPGRIFDLRHADLLGDTAATVKRLLDFCGLAWEPTCLDLARNTAPVSTLSVAQVRDAIQSPASRKWLPYSAHLAELQAALAALPPCM